VHAPDASGAGDAYVRYVMKTVIISVIFGILPLFGETTLPSYSVRVESDIKLSFSWSNIIRWHGDKREYGLLIQPMIGLSGSGIYLGGNIANKIDGVSETQTSIRPKIGALYTYNDPWILDPEEIYGYIGVELARRSYFMGINGHMGMTINENEDVNLSAGIGYGF